MRYPTKYQSRTDIPQVPGFIGDGDLADQQYAFGLCSCLEGMKLVAWCHKGQMSSLKVFLKVEENSSGTSGLSEVLVFLFIWTS